MASSEQAPKVDAGGGDVPLQHAARALRDRWWLPVAAALVAGGAGLIVATHVQRNQVAAAHYDAQAVVTAQDDPLFFHTNWPLFKAGDPSWMPEQIALLSGARARAIAARKAGISETVLRDQLSVRPLGSGSFAIAISDLPHAAAQRSLAAVVDAFRFLRREQTRRAAAFDARRLTIQIDRLRARLAKLTPASAAAKRVGILATTARGELAVDHTLMSVDPSGVTVNSTSLTSRTAVIDRWHVAIAALLVGLALGCFAALVAEGAEARKRARSA